MDKLIAAALVDNSEVTKYVESAQEMLRNFRDEIPYHEVDGESEHCPYRAAYDLMDAALDVLEHGRVEIQNSDEVAEKLQDMRKAKQLENEWKIQTPGMNGWGDQKVSVDGDDFEVELFGTYDQAFFEGQAAQDSELVDYTFRVVPATHPSDHDFYS